MKKTILQVTGIVLALAIVGCNSNQNTDDSNLDSNNPPVANAGQDQASGVLVGDAVVLDGSTSSDPDSDTLNYVWTLTSVPPDSAATLSNPLSDKPTFIADKPGTYIAELIVHDGKAVSPVDDVNVTVVIPPPVVTITTPVPDTIATENPVTVSGTVDDPSATITVNGAATPNNSGAYSAEVTLAEGSNTVRVIATNSTGEGNASVDVALRTVRGPGPAVIITSPKPDFTAGVVWDGIGAPPSNNIPIAVSGTVTTENGPPTVMVNGIVATTGALARNPLLNLFCTFLPNAPACDQRYSFAADIELNKGPQTITTITSDTVGGSTIVAVNGVADFCVKEGSTGLAERGNGQNNRCHEIDGCSNGSGAASDSQRNQPMPGARFNLVTVEFGSGTIPPTEFFVHGQSPQRLLGCNIHDTCYQTCVPRGGGDRIAAWHGCNSQQLGNHSAMCRKAYPATCPFTITGPLGNTFPDPVKCPQWQVEKATCFSVAAVYFTGVEVGGEFAYNTRQIEYCQ